MSASEEELSPAELQERKQLNDQLRGMEDYTQILRKLEGIFNSKNDMWFAMKRHAKVYLPKKSLCPLTFL
jgi:hypothetical protein